MEKEYINQWETEMSTGEREEFPKKKFMYKGQITIRPEIRKFPNLNNYEDALIKAIDNKKVS